jgi:hypothetical protein
MENKFNSVTTQVLNLNCSYQKAWASLSDPLFQKEWGVSFFKDVRKEASGFTAATRFGLMAMKMVCDEASGMIDTYMNNVLTNPSRLTKFGENACIYTFILFKPEVAPEEMFQSQGIPNLKKDLALLKQLLENSGH